MPLTALDVSQRQFKTAFRGPDRDEVQAFLAEVATALEEAAREAQELRDALVRREEELDGYKGRERMLHETLLTAQKACDDLNSRWYAARPIYCELSPVTDFREACCRLNSGEGCVRGGFCNFIHRKNPSDELDRDLMLSTKKWLKESGGANRSPTRSPSPEPTRKR